jgi:hypothetical protein
MTEEQREALDPKGRPCRCPDLLVYKPDLSDFYFCEVKGPRDRVRSVQAGFFRKLEERLGRPVHLAMLREV